MAQQENLPRWRYWLKSEALSALVLSMGAGTLGVAIPLYNVLSGNRLFLATDRFELYLVALVFHAAPVLAFFTGDRLLARSSRGERLRRVYWTAILIFVVGAVLREAHLSLLVTRTAPLPTAARLLILVVGLMMVVALCVFAFRAVRLWVTYMTPVALLVAAGFAYQFDMIGPPTAGSSPSREAAVSRAGAAPVFIIMFDGLNYDVLMKEGQVDEQRYPNFATLARDSVWFTNATANYVYTFYAVPSLLTGQLIEEEDRHLSTLPVSDFESRNLLTMLSRDYDVNVYQEHFNHCFTLAGECKVRGSNSAPSYLGSLAGILLLRWIPDTFADSLGIGDLVGRLNRNARVQFDEMIDDISGSSAPGQVYYYHTSRPHFVIPDPGESFASVYQKYRLKVDRVDAMLGSLISRLESEGLYESSVIIVTSDHGIRPTREIMDTRFPDELSDLIPHVPLAIKAPGLRPRRIDVEYQHLDFVPTILDVLELTGHGDFAGVSAFVSQRPERERVFYTFGVFGVDESYTYGRSDGRWHIVRGATARFGQGSR